MRPRELKRLLGCAFLGAIIAGAALGAGIARADGVISDAEYAYIQTYGASAVCPVLDEFPTKAGVFGIAQGIMDDGFTADSAVDILNASVSQFCDRHWQLLVEIGAEARGEILPRRAL